jgi:tetratricopeptide (TPR) repeat protein
MDYEEALRIRRKLVQDNPDVFRPKVALTLINLGNLDRAQNRVERAHMEYKEALQIYEPLVRQDPEQFLPKVAQVRKLLDELLRGP